MTSCSKIELRNPQTSKFFCENWSISFFWAIQRKKPYVASLFKKNVFFEQPYCPTNRARDREESKSHKLKTTQIVKRGELDM